MAKEWLKAASDDILTIQEIIDNEHLSSVVAFHSQQAIEKSFKALIVNSNQNIPKIHDIRRLHKLVDDKISLTSEEIDTLLIINELYIESRYPGDIGLLPDGKPTIEDAKEFYGLSSDIFNMVCKLLNVDKSELISN